MEAPTQTQPCQIERTSDFALKNLAILGGLTILAILVMGYHPGLEDDSFYLAAIKRHLNPALFPHDADFFQIQFHATIFDKLIAASVRLLHLRLAWTVLVWQGASVFWLLVGCWRIARRCFTRPEARWGAVTLVAVLLSMPLPGIAILLGDQYLHPRTLASAAILSAIVAIVDRKLWVAGVFLALAFSLHAIAACFGISLCAFLKWNLQRRRFLPSLAATALWVPFGWLFAPASDSWRQAAATRGFFFLGSWRWYEWLGVIAPLGLVFIVHQLLKRTVLSVEGSGLRPLLASLLYFAIFQMVVGLAIMLPPNLERLRPFEPMRYLHLLYLLFLLLAGGLIGAYILDRRAYRWLVLFTTLGGGMFYAQRQMYGASPHLELPFVSPENPWLRAFDWIRQYTPVSSSFAIDPHYETLPGENQHGFRALAERSVLADYEKDAGMVARVPLLAPRWLQEVTALHGWRTFQRADFERLNKDFGVNWVVLSRADSQFATPDSASIICPYANEDVKVCRLR
jgi:hypothetical protein